MGIMYYLFFHYLFVAYGIFGILAVAAGVGVVRRNPWAAKLMVPLAILTLIYHTLMYMLANWGLHTPSLVEDTEFCVNLMVQFLYWPLAIIILGLRRTEFARPRAEEAPPNRPRHAAVAVVGGIAVLFGIASAVFAVRMGLGELAGQRYVAQQREAWGDKVKLQVFSGGDPRVLALHGSTYDTVEFGVSERVGVSGPLAVGGPSFAKVTATVAWPEPERFELTINTDLQVVLVLEASFYKDRLTDVSVLVDQDPVPRAISINDPLVEIGPGQLEIAPGKHRLVIKGTCK